MGEVIMLEHYCVGLKIVNTYEMLWCEMNNINYYQVGTQPSAIDSGMFIN